MQSKMDTTYHGYRGTSYEWGKKCDKDNEFSYSEKDDEYFGHGIYFFENDYHEAYNWAKYVRRIPHKKIAVIYSLIEAKADKTLDFLNNKQYREYIELLDLFIKRINKEADYYAEIKNPYDCQVINLICDKCGFLLVRGTYKLNNEKADDFFDEDYTRFPKHHIQLCVRDEQIILESEVKYA